MHRLHKSSGGNTKFSSSTAKETFHIRLRLTCQSSKIVFPLYRDTYQQNRKRRGNKDHIQDQILPAPLKHQQKHRHLRPQTFQSSRPQHSKHETYRSGEQNREARFRRESFWISNSKQCRRVALTLSGASSHATRHTQWPLLGLGLLFSFLFAHIKTGGVQSSLFAYLFTTFFLISLSLMAFLHKCAHCHENTLYLGT